MVAWLDDPKLKDSVVDGMRRHREAESLIGGTYGDNDGNHCHVGCVLADLGEREFGDHGLYAKRIGVPDWWPHLMDSVFEGLYSGDRDRARAWSVEVLDALPVGADLDGLADRLAIRRLREECLPLSGTWPESIRAEVVAAIERVIAALESKEESAWSAAQSAARSAAQSAWSAARSAAQSAAWSAARSAWSAARSAAQSAWSAAQSAEWSAESAWSAARSAAFQREAERILAELRALGGER